MDLKDVVTACLRRWYVVVLVAGVFVWVALDQRASARPVYQVERVLAVVPSPTLAGERDGASGAGRVGDTNPFGSAANVALYLADLAEEQVEGAEGIDVSWSGLEPTLVRVLVTEPDAVIAARTGAGVETGLQRMLAALQDGQGVAPADRFQLLAASAPPDPVRRVPNTRSLGLGLVLAGGLAAATIATAVDIAVQRRRTDRSGEIGRNGAPWTTNEGGGR